MEKKLPDTQEDRPYGPCLIKAVESVADNVFERALSTFPVKH